MNTENRLDWLGFLGASLVLHAAVLGWMDFSGSEPGRLPETLKVLIAANGESRAAEPAPPPASASRNRDLFDRPPAQTAAVEPEPEPEPRPEPKAKTRLAAAPRAQPAPDSRPESKPESKPEPVPDPAPRRETAPPPHDQVAYADPAPAQAAPASDPGAAIRRGQLLTLLHAAISRQQRYPSLARRQRREGTATVSFRLSPSGDMDAVGIDRSSGFGPLDNAAVTAVSRVAPFAPARRYLTDATRFKVDVTFKLN